MRTPAMGCFWERRGDRSAIFFRDGTKVGCLAVMLVRSTHESVRMMVDICPFVLEFWRKVQSFEKVGICSGLKKKSRKKVEAECFEVHGLIFGEAVFF